MKKVIIVSTVGLIYDGITNIMMSYIKAMNKTEIDIFVASTIKAEPGIVSQLKQSGCHIVNLPSRRENVIKYFCELTNFIRKNKIDIIHAHGNSGTLAIEMIAGWLGGCNKRIAHSHNTKCDQVKADNILRPFFYLFYTDAVACGEEAGHWLFKNRQFTVLKNGRNIDDFLYNTRIRKEIREKLKIDNEIVIGHVGGFYEQKNHEFLMKIFRSIIEIEPNARLLLLGDGPLKEKIESSNIDIKDSVLFLGTTDHVSDYLQAMDGMLLPSLFEGLPLVAIEWQINGLPCIFADTITKDCGLMSNIKFMSLEESPKAWAMAILNLIRNNDRLKFSEMASSIVEKSGFDIKKNAEQLREIYISE
mgnify:CR=1 FL=1